MINGIWVEIVPVGAEFEKACMLITEFELCQSTKGRWHVSLCDGVAGKDIYFGVNDVAAQSLHDALFDMMRWCARGYVSFDEATMKTTIKQDADAAETSS